MGRPTKYNQDVADEIIDRTACGETLKSICEDLRLDPSTVLRWEERYPEFFRLLTRAREAGSHMLVGESREIVDDGRNDWMEKHDKDGACIGWRINGEAVARSKLRADQRWREAESLAPRTFAKRHQVEHSGGINVAVSKLTDEELVAEIMMLATSGRLKLPGGIEVAEIGDDEADDDFADIC